MTKKIIAIIMSLILSLALMIPAFADNDGIAVAAEDVSGEEMSEIETQTPTTAEPTTAEPTTVAPETTAAVQDEDDGGFELNFSDIMSSDIMQQIMMNENVIDITNLVIDLVAKYNPDSLKQMGQEEATNFIQSLVDTIGGTITQMVGNADLIITYDPLEVVGNLFDLDTDSLTTKNPENTTKHPDELELVLGDADGDGKITAADARMILRRAARIVVFTLEQDERADVDRDGKITANDARIVLRVSAGLETLDA